MVAVSNAEKEKLVQRGFDAKRMDVVLNAPVDSPRAQARKNASGPRAALSLYHARCAA